MITDAEIERVLSQGTPTERLIANRLVDRLRVAEGGGIRPDLKRFFRHTTSPVAFCGMSLSELTRDELVALIGWQQAHPNFTEPR